MQGQRIKEEEQEHIHRQADRIIYLKFISNLKQSKSVKVQLKTGENYN